MMLYLEKKSDKNELPSAGKIIIDEFNIRIPYVVYDDMNKIKLINELTSLSQRNEYMFIFKSWQCIEATNITGKTLTKDITNMYRNVRVSFGDPIFSYAISWPGLTSYKIQEIALGKLMV